MEIPLCITEFLHSYQRHTTNIC